MPHVVLGTYYKHELDVVPAPQGGHSVVGEGKLVSKQMFTIFSVVESLKNIGNVLPETIIKR